MSMLSRFATLGGAATDPYWANVSYLLVGNGANGTTTNIKDSSNNNLTTTIFGNTVISTAQSKYGSGSVYFDGNGDYLTLPSTSLLSFGTGNFTIEGWVYFPSFGGTSQGIIGIRPETSASGLSLYVASSNILGLQIGAGFIDSTNSFSVNTWYYIAVVRSGTSVVIYVNGTSWASGTSSVNLTDTNCVLGRAYTDISNYYLNGYLYDLRITKGVARYSGSTMTVPTAPLPIG